MIKPVKYYSIKNAAQSDIDAAVNYIPGTDGINTYHILEYNEPQSFGNGETWFIELTHREVVDNKYNPIYYDISQLDPYELGANIVEAAKYNQQFVKDLIIESAAGHLFKNGLLWTSAQKKAFNVYWSRILFYSAIGNVGEMRNLLLSDIAILQTPGIITVTDPFDSNTTYNVDVLTEEMVQHAIDLTTIYKKKFPDGTV